jgi:hypothetical protein
VSSARRSWFINIASVASPNSQDFYDAELPLTKGTFAPPTGSAAVTR